MPDIDKPVRCRWRKCPSPGPYPDDKALYEHLNNAHNQGTAPNDGRFHCKWDGCVRKTLNLKGYGGRANHLITHTAYRPFECDCGATFNRTHHLEKHVDNVHAGREDDSGGGTTDGEMVVESEDESANEPFECTTFDGDTALRVHEKAAHPKPVAGKSKSKKRNRAGDLEVAGTTKKRKLSNTATTSSAVTLLTVEEWSDDDSPVLEHDEGNEPDKFLVLGRMLAAEKRLARLEARVGQDTME